MNRVILMGRLTRDPVITYSGDMAIAKYTLAVDRRTSKDAEKTADFISIVAFGKSGEFAQKYFCQGMRVLVEGHIQTGSYTNKDGQVVYTTDVVVDNQEFADGKRDGNGNNSQTKSQNSQKQTKKTNTSSYGGYADDFMNVPDNIDDEGLPFN